MTKLFVSRPNYPPAPVPALPLLSLAVIRHRMKVLKILVPVTLFVLVAVYELLPARWIHDALGQTHSYLAEILFFGTLGPVLAYGVLDVLGRWLEERETNEVQSRVLAQAREQAKVSEKLSDDALQALFAATLLLNSLETTLPDLPPGTVAQLRATRHALEQTILRVSAYLASKSSPDGQRRSRPAR